MTITLTAAEQAVLVAVFEQIDISRIDKEKLQVGLSSPTKNAAGKRLTRVREKLNTWARAGVASSTTFTAAEQCVLVAIFGQVNFGKIDKAKLQTDLGLPSKNAAGKRVARLREKINNRGEAGAPSLHKTTSASSAKKSPQSTKNGKQGSTSSVNKNDAVLSDGDDKDRTGFLSTGKDKFGNFGWEDAVGDTKQNVGRMGSRSQGSQ